MFYLITIVRIWLSPCFNGRRYDEVTDIAGYSTAVPGKMSMIVFSSYHCEHCTAIEYENLVYSNCK